MRACVIDPRTPLPARCPRRAASDARQRPRTCTLSAPSPLAQCTPHALPAWLGSPCGRCTRSVSPATMARPRAAALLLVLVVAVCLSGSGAWAVGKKRVKKVVPPKKAASATPEPKAAVEPEPTGTVAHDRSHYW